MVKKRSINFYQGRICIREPDGTLNFQDDNHIPEIKKKILEYVNSEAPKLEIRYIIYSTIKDYFGINALFMLPEKNTTVPSDDPLYRSLEKLIFNTDRYQSHIKNTEDFARKVRESKANYKKKNSTYYDYRRNLFDNKLK